MAQVSPLFRTESTRWNNIGAHLKVNMEMNMGINMEMNMEFIL